VTATATREKPILFADRLVRAIRDGRKTVTRRPIKPQPTKPKYMRFSHTDGAVGAIFAEEDRLRDGMQVERYWCPFGSPGDMLYVRECWGPRMENGKPVEVQQYVKYRADFADDSLPADGMDWHTYEDKWRPSIHMPKWAARLWLEIVSVRVERIQEITSDDCLLEGIEPQGIGSDMAMVAAFRKSWDSIYPGSWDRNDFIWRIEFRNSKGAADA
jgi:hypothetical protein